MAASRPSQSALSATLLTLPEWPVSVLNKCATWRDEAGISRPEAKAAARPWHPENSGRGVALIGKQSSAHLAGELMRVARDDVSRQRHSAVNERQCLAQRRLCPAQIPGLRYCCTSRTSSPPSDRKGYRLIALHALPLQQFEHPPLRFLVVRLYERFREVSGGGRGFGPGPGQGRKSG